MTSAGDGTHPVRRRLLTWGLPALAVAAAVAAVALTLGSGGDGDDVGAVTATSRSSTIAWAEDGETLWLTSPDDDQLVAIDPSTLEVTDQIEVAGQPRELSVLGPELVVTAAQSDVLAIVDPGAAPDEVVATVPIPCGGSRAVVTVPSSAGNLAVVTCPTDDRLVVVDIDRLLAIGTVELTGRPTGLVRDGEQLTVSTALDGQLHTVGVADLVRAADEAEAADGDGAVPALEVPASSRPVWVDGGRTASTLAALDTGPRGPVGTYQVVDNERKLSRAEIEAGSTYGSPKDGRARLEPALAGACGARFSSLTDEPRRLSGPVALAAAPGSDLVWVVGEFSHSVSVVRCDGSKPSQTSATVAAFDVGEGARGIVLSADGTRAFVDVGFDHEVAELRFPDGPDGPDGVEAVDGDDAIERVEPIAVGRRDVDDRYLSPLAQEGRRMFNDATDTHLTPFGVVACGSCHPSAGEDGLSWRIESSDPATKAIDRKVRRTPPAWLVDPSVKPLHWDGEFTSTDDLSLDTIQQLLGGDGLLVDTAAISAYLAEVDAPPSSPAGDERATELSTLAGERAMAQAGCTTCHVGEAGTDGEAHDVLEPSTVPDGDLPAVVTPPLRAVRGRAPFGHDGRAPDLEALLDQHGDGEGGTIVLTPEQRTAILAYLGRR